MPDLRGHRPPLGRRGPRCRKRDSPPAEDGTLSLRLRETLRQTLPDIAPKNAPAFRSPRGAPIHYFNFRNRVWSPIVEETFQDGRRFTVHGLRHTWASLHLAAGTPLKWIQTQGGWTSAKLLLDTYGHFLPREMNGFEDALAPKNRNRPELQIG